MRIFMTGASGYIGSHVAKCLISRGHTVSGLSRSQRSCEQLTIIGVHPLSGSLGDKEVLRRAAMENDCVVHAAFNYDSWEDIDAAFRMDQEATLVMLEALAGSERPFIYTSGAGIIGDTGKTLAREDVVPNPPPIARLRADVERQVIRAEGVRGIVIRPGLVYGNGGGVLIEFIRLAREQSVPRTLGTGENAWSCVHVDDLAELYALAIEKAPAGSILHGAAGEPVSMREIISAISYSIGKGGKTEPWNVDDARQVLPWVDGVIIEQRISAILTQNLVGWVPRKPSIIQELKGHP